MLGEYTSLAVYVGLVFVAASSGALFKPGPWYDSLNKPTWTPPDWAFPVAWTVLYLMIAVAGWYVWQGSGWSWATIVWGIGLALNASWSYVMFGRKEIGSALVNLILLWLATLAFIVLAWPIDQTAAYLFMPYLAWVSFAGLLNLQVWRMNGAKVASRAA